MAYQFHEGMIKQNEDTLHSIATALAEGQPFLIPYPTFHEASIAVPKMHNLLKAAEIMIHECGGRYSHLRKACKVGLHTQAGIPGVVISLKHPRMPIATAAQIGALSEKDIVRFLQDNKPDRYEATFLPTPDYTQNPEGWYTDMLGLCGYYMEEDEPHEISEGQIRLTCVRFNSEPSTLRSGVDIAQ